MSVEAFGRFWGWGRPGESRCSGLTFASWISCGWCKYSWFSKNREFCTSHFALWSCRVVVSYGRCWRSGVWSFARPKGGPIKTGRNPRVLRGRVAERHGSTGPDCVRGDAQFGEFTSIEALSFALSAKRAAAGIRLKTYTLHHKPSYQRASAF